VDVAPSEEDIAVIRRALEEFEVGRTDLEEYYGRFWHPDAEIEAVDGFPVPGTYRGLDGYRRWYEEAYAPYEDVKRRIDSISVEGDCVLVLLTISGHPKDDDLELEVQTGSAYDVEDGRIKRLCVYVGHDRAVLAARTNGQRTEPR
jgi:ketosteroid isomerase-like protein